ncbi:MAG: amino acid adenylation domain-containing protein, partial [Dinghuibacter sp.]|nr:amino acid adenylation domain-containing protein [Dinghuibacter sp.]
MSGKIEKSNVQHILELSAVQKGMLYHHLKETDENLYNVQLIFELEGELNSSLLQQAIEQVQEGNEVLRSVFSWEKLAQPVQVILKKYPVSFVVTDIQPLQQAEQEHVINRLTANDRNTRFGLNEPPVRFRLLQTGPKTHLFSITHHHLLYDGWSTGILIRELFSHYRHLVSGVPEETLHKPAFRELVLAAQKKREQGGAAAGFWKEYLFGYDHVSLLTGQLPDEGIPQTTGRVKGRLHTAGLEAFVNRYQVTPAAVMMTVFGLVLQEYTHRNDVALGTTLSNREISIKGNEGVMGNFITTLPLRVTASGEMYLYQVVQQVFNGLLQLNEHQYTAYSDVKEWLNVSPLEDLFHLLVAIENYPVPEGVTAGTPLSLRLQSVHENTGIPVVATVFLQQEPEIEICYRTALCSNAFAESLLQMVNNVLQQLLQFPELQVRELEPATPEQRRQVLAQFNPLPEPYPRNASLHGLFEQVAERFPNRVAVRKGEEYLTYSQLNERANQLAHLLLQHSVPPGSCIAIFANRALETYIAKLAILKAGAAYLPLDTDFPPERLQYLLQQCRSPLALALPEHKHLAGNIPVIDLLQPLNTPVHNPGMEVPPLALAYVMHTSGSTGLPKGVMVHHRGIIRLVCNTNYIQLDEEVHMLQTGAPTFDAITFETWGSFLHGGCLCLIDKEVLLDTSELEKAMQQYRVTTLYLTATLFNFHVRNNVSLFDGVKHLLIGGEALSPNDINLLRNHNSTIQIINGYGPTENTTFSVCYDIRSCYRYNVPIGRPISHSTAYVFNRFGHLLPPNVPGELFVGGDGVAHGYLQQEALTAEKFVNDPFLPGEKMYRTGDLAKWLPDGILEYWGRMDAQVKIRGFRIEPGEIEFHLGLYEGIRSSTIVAREKDGNKFLVAYYVADQTINGEELRRFLADKLPGYMVPLYYVQVPGFQVTANGKIDRRSLPEPAVLVSGTINLPETPLEKQLAGIWAALLSLQPEEIPADRSFFEMGGHSLRATTLVNRVLKELNVAIPLRDVFRYNTIRGQAGYIENAGKKNYEQIPVAPPQEYYTASFSQKRLYFLYQLNRSSLAYNMPFIAWLNGTPDREQLTAVFGKMIRRHESLRTSFHFINEEIVQQIHDQPVFSIEEYEHGNHPETAIQRFVRPFNLEAAPLLRVGLSCGSDGKWLLMIDVHHIVYDGVSKTIFIREFVAGYNGTTLPALPIQYKDFSAWQHTDARRKQVMLQQPFWLNQYAELPGALSLPADFNRPPVKSYQGSAVHFGVSAHTTARLKALAESEGTTLFTLLLSVYTILLSKLGNQYDVVVGTPVANRTQAELEEVIGLLINTLPMRNQPRGTLNFRRFLANVHQNALGCFENQLYPYEELVEALQVNRDPARNPLFDHFFIYENFESAEFTLPGSQLSVYPYIHPYTKFDLTLIASDTANGLSFILEYDTALFTEATVQRFGDYFQQLLSSVLMDADTLLCDLEMMNAAERSQLLFSFNNTTAPVPEQETIVTLFEKMVNLHPGNTAVLFEEQAITYNELNMQVNRWAHLLREEYDIKPGVLVAIMLNRSVSMLVAMLAVLKAGGAYVPVDPMFPKERKNYILDNCAARLLITKQHIEHGFNGAVVLLQPGWAASRPGSNPVPVNQPGDTCYMIYTSGSTGKPKGTIITHGNVVNFFEGMNQQVQPGSGEQMLAVTSTSFDISVLELFWTLCQGIGVVLHPTDNTLTGLDTYLGAAGVEMDFSLFFFSSYDHSNTDKYNLLFESVKYADANGFKAVWVPERHFHEFGGLYPNPSVVSAALAMVTQQIELRSGSVVSPLHHPLRIAEEWAVVDNFSRGRVAISFASGWNPDDFVLAPGQYTQRQKVMYEQIDTVRRLWKGESITCTNGQGKPTQVRIFPQPIQPELPVWVTSAGSAETFRSAGWAGAGVLTHFLGQDVEMLAENIRVYRAARKEAGYDPGRVSVMLHTLVGEQMHEVEQLVEGPFIEYLKTSIGLSKVIFEQAGFKEEELTEDFKGQLMKAAYRRYLHSGSLIGTRESCSQMVQQLQAIGVNEIACLIDFGVAEQVVLQKLDNLVALARGFKPGRQQQGARVSMMQSTPSYIKLLLNDAGSQQFLQSLHTLLVGGEAFPLNLARQLMKTAPQLRILNMYGPTETTIWSSVATVPQHAENITIGRPILNTRFYILGPALELLPVGVTGDLYIAGRGLARGYWKQETLTAEKFIANPYEPGELMYLTGDLARWLPNGEVEYIGRKDAQVKMRGYRIELGEIEENLRLFSGVREAAVVLRSIEPGGEPQLAAFYEENHPLNINDIRNWLAERLPYYMVPAQFVLLPALPLTPNGKIDRKPLLQLEINITGSESYVVPETEEELLLCGVWSAVLGRDRIGVRDNFFSVGGDSIKSIQIVSRIQQLGYSLNVNDIFTAQTVGELAKRLRRKQVESDQAPVTGRGVLTPIQRWLLEGPVQQKHHYNQSVLLYFKEGLSRPKAEAIFGKLQEHHDALRMVFVREGEQWYTESLPVTGMA